MTGSLPLEPRAGGRITLHCRCYERSSERRPMRIFPGPRGFAVSAFGVWFKGIYSTFATAEQVAMSEGCEPEGTARTQADAAELKRQRKNARCAAS